MASAMSVTWNSSKQSSQLSSAISPAARRIGVLALDFAVLDLLAETAHPLVNIGHELVKVRAALADHRTRLEEQVHQHGLAAADFAVDVETLHGSLADAAAEQPAQRRAGAPSGARLRAARARRSGASRLLLRRVALDFPGGDQVFVEFADGHGGRVRRGLRRPRIGPGGCRQASPQIGRFGMPAMQIATSLSITYRVAPRNKRTSS